MGSVVRPLNGSHLCLTLGTMLIKHRDSFVLWATLIFGYSYKYFRILYNFSGT